MSGRQAFEAWAPAEVEWSKWAKPTLFVHPTVSPPPGMGLNSFQAASAAPEMSAATSAIERVDSDDLVWPRALPRHSALVLELPPMIGIAAGVALRDKGLWPVPLYNATTGQSPLIDVWPTVRALQVAAPLLQGRGDSQTLPCFLLDAGRCPEGSKGTPGKYDNRSMVFPQDFPSATLMRARGVEQVVVVTHASPGQATKFEPAKDLAHVLFGWQRDGLRLMHTTTVTSAAPVAITVTKPKEFGLAVRRIMMLTGFRRSAAGGFGAFIPVPQASSGYS